MPSKPRARVQPPSPVITRSRVDSVMSTDLITLEPDADLRDGLKFFEGHPIRRLPRVAGQRLVGILTMDDLVVDMTADLARLARPIAGDAPSRVSAPAISFSTRR